MSDAPSFVPRSIYVIKIPLPYALNAVEFRLSEHQVLSLVYLLVMEHVQVLRS